MGKIRVKSTEALYVAADPTSRVRLSHARGPSVYYDNTSEVSSGTKDGTLEAGGSGVIFDEGVYLKAASATAYVWAEDVDELDGRDLATQTELEAQITAVNKGLIFDAVAYGAKGDNSTDDTTALKAAAEAAIAAGGGTVWVAAGKVFRYSSLEIKGDNLYFTGGGTLRSTVSKSAETIPFHIFGDNVHVDGLTFDYVTGVTVATDKAEGPANNGHCIRISGTKGATEEKSTRSVNVSVRNCTISDSRASGINIYFCSKALVSGNTIERNLKDGIWVTDSTTDIRVEGNSIKNTGDDAIGVYTTDEFARAERVVVANNTISESSAKGIGISGVDGAVVSGNVIDTTWDAGIRIFEEPGYNDTHYVTVADNILRNVGTFYGEGKFKTEAGNNGIGITIEASVKQPSVRGNTIINPEREGIVASKAVDLSVEGNTVKEATRAGILVGSSSGSEYTEVVGGIVRGNITQDTANGIIVGCATSVVTTGNYCQTFSVGGGTDRGLMIRQVKECLTYGNLLVNDDEAASGFFVTGTNIAARHWGNHTIVPASEEKGGYFLSGERHISWGAAAPTTGTWQQGDIVFQTDAAPGEPFGWYCRTGGTPGTWYKMGDVLPRQASTRASAEEMILGNGDSVALVTGNTEIKKIKATTEQAGQVVVLKFASTPKVVDGENLKLKENLEATADDTLTLACDGVTWYEVGRSVN